MSRTVWKFRLGKVVFTWLREGDVIRHVAAQHPTDDAPTVWVELDPDVTNPPTDRLLLVGTGWPVPEGAEFAGSAVCAEGRLVWHVYRESLGVGEGRL